MAQDLPRRANYNGPELVRLLSRLVDTDIPEPEQSLSDRLSQWLGWNDAIALASALNGSLPTVATAAQRAPASPGSADAEEDYARVRAALEKAIAGLNETASSRPGSRQRVARPPQAKAVPPVGYSSYRQRYIFLQQSMESSICELRARLRISLASRSPLTSRLALLDAAMEQALKEREYELLAAIPAMLEKRFNHLRHADAARQGAEDPQRWLQQDDWLDVFRRDMQSVLRAELYIRIQPVDGLLAALRVE